MPDYDVIVVGAGNAALAAANSAHELSLDLIAVRTELEAVVQCQIKQGQHLENCESVIDTLRNEKLYKRLHANDLFARDFTLRFSSFMHFETRGIFVRYYKSGHASPS